MSVLRILCSVFVLTASSLAAAAPRFTLDPPHAGPPTGSVCGNGRLRCLAHVVLTPDGQISANVNPAGLVPADIQSAYNIDTNISGAPTVAIVDAFGYANLESDLATYRSQFGLPPCTRSNGCLTIVNQNGQPSPLPDDPPANDDWTIETALDIDMVSAACPRCKILVVQADDNQGDGLFFANDAAASLHATTVSNSWGGSENPSSPVSAVEGHFDHPGIAIFASGGDSGYDNAGVGPNYPATSAYVIGVGGTRLARSSAGRGWSETAWSKGGSGCSLSVPKPSFQPPSPCAFRASADVAAVGDPATGVAVYATNGPGWIVVGGTSAASPIVAAIFAATDHGNATPAFVAQSTSAYYDVTSGSNGSCGSILCTAGVGWDGPTGYGTPNASALAGTSGGGGGGGGGGLGVKITTPADNAHVNAEFPIVATASGPTVAVGLGIDGKLVSTLTAPPYVFHAPPSLSTGAHTVQVAVADANQNVVVTEIHVVVEDLPPPDDLSGSDGTAACSTSHGADGVPLALVLVGLVARRRRRANHDRAR